MRNLPLYQYSRTIGACIRYWCLSAMIIFTAQAAGAQDALTLQEASRRVLQNNPELQVFQWRMQAADGVRQTANLRPGLELGIEAENILGSGEFSGTDRAEYTLSLSSLIELGGKRQSRIAAANSRYALAQIVREAQALDVLGQVTQRFIAALALHGKLLVSEEATLLAKASWQSVNQRVDRGAAPEVERLRAEASLTQAQLRQSALEAEFASQKVALATLWGAETTDFGTLTGDLYAFETAEAFDVLYQRVAESPAIQLFATEARLRDAELKLARSHSSSNVRWSVGIKQFDDTGDSALTAGLSVPLFSANRNRGNTQSALAEREMVDYRKQATMLKLRARLYEAWQTHQQSVVAVKQLRESVLPTLEKALTQTRQAYELGRYRYTDLVSVQRELLDARLAMIDAASTALLNQALIEQLTAQPLVAGRATAKQGSTELQSTTANNGRQN